MPKQNNNAKQFDVLKKKYEVFRNNAPEVAAMAAVNFFKRNFELQGFVDNSVEKWKKLSNPANSNKRILQTRGTLKNSIKKITATRNKIVVGVPADVKYAALQNYGGQVPITSKMRRYFWAMYKQTEQEYWKGLALTKKKHLDIPARKFIGDSAGLIKNVDRNLARELKKALEK